MPVICLRLVVYNAGTKLGPCHLTRINWADCKYVQTCFVVKGRCVVSVDGGVDT